MDGRKKGNTESAQIASGKLPISRTPRPYIFQTDVLWRTSVTDSHPDETIRPVRSAEAFTLDIDAPTCITSMTLRSIASASRQPNTGGWLPHRSRRRVPHCKCTLPNLRRRCHPTAVAHRRLSFSRVGRTSRSWSSHARDLTSNTLHTGGLKLKLPTGHILYLRQRLEGKVLFFYFIYFNTKSKINKINIFEEIKYIHCGPHFDVGSRAACLRPLQLYIHSCVREPRIIIGR